jgi:hypothetical protein
MSKLSEAAAVMGRKGGAVRSARKKRAAQLSARRRVASGNAKGAERIYPPCTKEPPYANKAHRFSKAGRCYGCGYQR